MMVLARIGRSLRTAPGARDLLDLAVAVAVVAALAGGIGWTAGLFSFEPLPPGRLLSVALIALFVPALGEELVFRAAMIPDRGEAPRAAAAIAASTALFVLWHLLEAHTFLPQARALFTRPAFLACAAGLGLACAVLRRRSGSIWTAVALHWAAVAVWKGWLGGPA